VPEPSFPGTIRVLNSCCCLSLILQARFEPLMDANERQ
jgi:hypothetical protein